MFWPALKQVFHLLGMYTLHTFIYHRSLKGTVPSTGVRIPVNDPECTTMLQFQFILSAGPNLDVCKLQVGANKYQVCTAEALSSVHCAFARSWSSVSWRRPY